MYEKLQTPYAKRIFKKRGSTVEPELGTMHNFLNLKRVNTTGIKQANKHSLSPSTFGMMMSALTYNLKKLLKWKSKKLNAQLVAMEKPLINSFSTSFSNTIISHTRTLHFLFTPYSNKTSTLQ